MGSRIWSSIWKYKGQIFSIFGFIFPIFRPLLDTDFGHISFPVEFEERSYEQESFEDAALRVRYIPLIDNTNQTNTSQVQRVDVAYLVELKVLMNCVALLN